MQSALYAIARPSVRLSVTRHRCISQQESWAIAKTTARCAQYMGPLKSFESPHKRTRLLFPKYVTWFDRMCVQNLKFVALSVPEIIGGTEKKSPVPGYAHAPFSPKFWRAFVWMDPVNIPAKFKVRTFVRSWDNRGYSKNFGTAWMPHAPLSPKFLIGFCSDRPCEYACQIWSS